MQPNTTRREQLPREQLPNTHRNEVAETADEEQIAWLKTAPDKVFLYAKPEGPQRESPAIQTYLGTDVATEVKLGAKVRNGFGFHSYRRSVDCRIFGVRYVGWFMESSGDYCRLRKAKRSIRNYPSLTVHSATR